MIVTGFTAGSWDLLHTGHILFLQQCKRSCDRLIVGLQTDPTVDRFGKNVPVQSVFERQQQLLACRYVDDVVVYTTEKELETYLSTASISRRYLGSEYSAHEDFTGKNICRIRGIGVEFIPRNHKYSSSELRKRVFDAESTPRPA